MSLWELQRSKYLLLHTLVNDLFLYPILRHENYKMYPEKWTKGSKGIPQCGHENRSGNPLNVDSANRNGSHDVDTRFFLPRAVIK